MVARSDNQLLKAICEGDILAYEELVKRYQRGVFVFVNRIIRDEHNAEAIALDALFAVYQTIDRIDLSKKFSTYLFEIAKNRAISFLRKEKQHISLERLSEIEDDASLYENVYKADISAGVRAALIKLPRHYRQVLRLYYFDDLSYGEVSKKLGIPLNTVRTHIRRAKGIIQKFLSHEKNT